MQLRFFCVVSLANRTDRILKVNQRSSHVIPGHAIRVGMGLFCQCEYAGFGISWGGISALSKQPAILRQAQQRENFAILEFLFVRKEHRCMTDLDFLCDGL